MKVSRTKKEAVAEGDLSLEGSGCEDGKVPPTSETFGLRGKSSAI